MTAWFGIRVKTEAQALNAVRSKILGWPNEVFRDVYKPIIYSIAYEGRDYIREIILNSTTKTGRKREESGKGVAGRVRTGLMYNSVKVRIRDRVNGVTVNVGWVDGRPGYAIFQELGTRGDSGGETFSPREGIVGMDAIQQSHEYMLSRLREAAKGKYTGDRNYSLELSD